MELIEKERLKNRFNAEFERFNCYRWDLSAIIDEIDDAPTITLPPNDPLTLEELREMEGEPVWVCNWDGSDGMWALVDVKHEACRRAKGGFAMFDGYSKTWLAYRRKPEEGKAKTDKLASPTWAEHFQSRFERVE